MKMRPFPAVRAVLMRSDAPAMPYGFRFVTFAVAVVPSIEWMIQMKAYSYHQKSLRFHKRRPLKNTLTLRKLLNNQKYPSMIILIYI